MTRPFGKIVDRVAAKYNEAKAENGVLGLRMVGGEILGEKHAKIIVASSTPVEVPNLRAFVFQSLNFQASPVEDSYAFYQGEDGSFYATVVVVANEKKFKPIQDAALVRIGANSYLDEQMNEIWNKETVEGVECYTRQNQADLSEMLTSFMIASTSNTSRAVISAATFHNMPKKGDMVDVCFKDDDGQVTVATGTVNSVSENDVKVSVKGGKSISVPFGAVVKIHMDKAEKQNIVDYLNKAYTPEGSNVKFGDMLKKGI